MVFTLFYVPRHTRGSLNPPFSLILRWANSTVMPNGYMEGTCYVLGEPCSTERRTRIFEGY